MERRRWIIIGVGILAVLFVVCACCALLTLIGPYVGTGTPTLTYAPTSTAISIPTSTSVPTGTPTPAVATLASGESIIIFPEPVEGTPKPDPQLAVIARIRDAVTDQPVVASRITLGGEVIAKGVSEFQFTLPGEVLEYIFLKVQAPGYEEWEIGFRHQLLHSRVYPLQIELRPKPTKSIPQS